MEQLITTFPVAGQRVISGEMPHHVLGDQRDQYLEVSIPECVDGPDVGQCVWMIVAHSSLPARIASPHPPLLDAVGVEPTRVFLGFQWKTFEARVTPPAFRPLRTPPRPCRGRRPTDGRDS